MIRGHNEVILIYRLLFDASTANVRRPRNSVILRMRLVEPSWSVKLRLKVRSVGTDHGHGIKRPEW